MAAKDGWLGGYEWFAGVARSYGVKDSRRGIGSVGAAPGRERGWLGGYEWIRGRGPLLRVVEDSRHGPRLRAVLLDYVAVHPCGLGAHAVGGE